MPDAAHARNAKARASQMEHQTGYWIRNVPLGKKAQLNLPPLPGADKATVELIARSNEYHPDYRPIRAPALGVFVTYDEPPKSSLWDEATKAKLLA